jgi:sugar phosphate isomerase/epimerase
MKIGVMNNPAHSVYDETMAFGKAGYEFIDLTIEGPRALDIDTDKMGALLRQYNLAITGHTDPCLPWAYPVREIRQACLNELERCARIFSALGANIMNIHPCYFSPPAMRSSIIDLNIEALQPIVQMASAHDLTIAIENFTAPFDRVATFKRLLGEVEQLSLHLDFGHANIGRDNHEAFCRQLGEHITHVHFSDNRATADHHMPLGVGNIDWKNAVNELKATGYDGTITLEVFCEDSRMLFKYLDLSRKYVQKLWHGKSS